MLDAYVFAIMNPQNGLELIVSKKFRFHLHTYTRKQRFEKVPLWRAFSKSSVFIDRFHRIRVDGSRIRKEKVAFSNQNGYLWTGTDRVSRIARSIYENDTTIFIRLD